MCAVYIPTILACVQSSPCKAINFSARNKRRYYTKTRHTTQIAPRSWQTEYYECAGCLLNLSNADLNPICYLLALLGAHLILHVSGLRVKICLAKNYLRTLYFSFSTKCVTLLTFKQTAEPGKEKQQVTRPG